MLKLLKKEKGITLIALIVTIIILIILAGISISALTGDSSLINNADSAKNNTDISREKEIIELSAVQAMGENRRGILKRDKFDNTLKINSGNDTSLDQDEDEEMFIVTFIRSQRVYNVNDNGDADFLGDMEIVKKTSTISANPSTNPTPRAVQSVNLSITTVVGVESDEIFIHYAWTDNENTTPSSYKPLSYTTSASKKRREATVATEGGPAGNYYLWVQVDIDGTLNTKQFGPYTVLDNNPLIATNGEGNATSSFLNSASKQSKNITMTRADVESVTITNSITGHSLSDSNCWDVSKAQNGTVLAWYETDGDYYKVTIGANGGVVANPNSQYLFSNIGANGNEGEIKIDGLNHLDTSLVTNMSFMFSGCTNVKNIDVSNFSTINVTNMRGTFLNCKAVESLAIENWDTKNVINLGPSFFTDGGGMFQGCKNLKSLDLSKWDTSNVVRCSRMFSDSGVTSINFGNKFNTEKIKSMDFMFQGCSNLTSLDLTSFNPKEVGNTRQMFGDCTSLKNITFPNSFNTSKVADMQSMFYNCPSLVSLDLSVFNTSNVTNMSGMFNGCTNLKTLNIRNFDTKKVTGMGSMFSGCQNLESLDINTSSDSSTWDVRSVKAFSSTFSGCKKLKTLNLNRWITESATSMISMFSVCSSLENINVNSFDTSNVTDMSWMYNGCTNLESLDLTNWNTEKVTTFRSFMQNCKNLKTLNISKTNFKTNEVTNMLGMFINCENLTSLDVSGFDTSNVTIMTDMFNSCKSLTTIDVSGFNTSNVSKMQSMFNSCTSLISIDVDSFDVSKVTNTSSMFRNCTSLKTIYCNKDWKSLVPSGLYYVNMFENNPSLVGAVPYDPHTGRGIECANPTTGYFTHLSDS